MESRGVDAPSGDDGVGSGAEEAGNDTAGSVAPAPDSRDGATGAPDHPTVMLDATEASSDDASTNDRPNVRLRFGGGSVQPSTDDAEAHEGATASTAGISEGSPSRPKHPRIAIRVIDHPTDWVDGDDAMPRAEGLAGRIPAFDASFFDAPPAEPTVQAEGPTNALRVHTGAEADLSFGDFVGEAVGAGDDLPEGVTAAVRRTAPLSPDGAASVSRALEHASEPDQLAPPLPSRSSRAAGASTRRKVMLVGAPALFFALLVLSMVLSRSPSRPKVTATKVTPSSAATATSTTTTRPPAPPPSAETPAPATSVAAPAGTSGSATAVQAASVGRATPRTGGSTGSGRTSPAGGGSPQPPPSNPPTTQPAPPPVSPPPTTAPPATQPPSCPPWMRSC